MASALQDSPAPLRMELLGGYVAYEVGKANPLPIRSNARILILLALHSGNDLSRKAIIQALWPDQDIASALNRLRVALSGLRKQLGPALIDQDGFVRFDLDRVDIDYWSNLERLGTIKDEVDEQQELQQLIEQLDVLGKTLLPEFEEPWIETHRQGWTLAAHRGLQRLSILAAKESNFRLVIQAAEAAFQHDPFDDFHWQAFLKAKAMLGDAADGLRAFAQAQRRLKSHLDGVFSEETLAVSADIRLGRFSLNDRFMQVVHQREAEYFARLVNRAIESDPEAAMSILGITAAGYEHTNYPDISIPLLESLVNRVTSRSENWQRTLFSLIVVKSGINDSDAVLELGPRLLEATNDLRMIALTKAYMAFACLQKRWYSQGIHIIDEGLTLMENANRGRETYQLYTNKASLLWHQGHYDEALKLYDLSNVAADFIGGDAGQRIRGVNSCNVAMVHIMRGTPEDGKESMERAIEILTKIGLESTYPLLFPAAGYLRYLVDDDLGGIEMLIQGLKIAYRRNHERGQQIGLDYAAAALAKAQNATTARKILAYARDWRESTAHPFSVAEQMLVDRILVSAGGMELGSNEWHGHSPRVVLNQVVRALRAISRRTISA